MRSFRALSLILVGISAASQCSACSVVYGQFDAGPELRVRVVSPKGFPASGLRVDLGDYHATTDKDGIAFFHNVEPGSWSLGIDHDAGVPDGAGVKVTRDGPAGVIVPLTWPSIEPLLTRSLRGTLRGSDYSPGRPQAEISLDLLEGISGKILKSAQTSDHSEFHFDDIAPGLYFLHLKPSGISGWSGLVAVSVASDASADHLDIDLGWTSCGLAYADRSRCPESDLHVGGLRGQVLDPSGAALSGADILISDGSEKPIQTRADREGRFESSLALPGSYELVVKMPGFQPLRTRLTVDPVDARAQNLALNVQLGLLFAGSCSYAKAQ